MTNGSVEITKGALQKGRLDPYVHVNKMMDVVQAGIWKPRAECYHYAAQQLGLEPSEVPRLPCLAPPPPPSLG